ncbi:MAG: type-F conjugative transfer system secretin TraK [Syntrophorhabdaceae bacterium]|nr:type-F conjugative transfer system secretin TraK [Syntrophorhabdaceae bacterium]
MNVHIRMFLPAIFLVASLVTPAYSQTCGPQGCPQGNPAVQGRPQQQPVVVQSFYGNPPDSRQPGQQPRQETKPARQNPPIPGKNTADTSPIPVQSTGVQQKVSPKKAPLVEFTDASAPHPADEFVANQRILPEVASQVHLSSSDINRVVCPVEIKDVVFSKEKGITVKLAGNNAFVKFLVMKKDGRDFYSSTPSEIFIVCGEQIYNIIAVPKRVPSQTIRLSPGKTDTIRRNAALFGELPFEKKIVTIIKSIYRDDLPDSLTTRRVDKTYETFQDLNLVLHRIFTVDGEGLRIKEFIARLSDNSIFPAVYLKEKDFLSKDLAQKPVAVSIETMNLRKGEMSRIFVVERTEGEQL